VHFFTGFLPKVLTMTAEVKCMLNLNAQSKKMGRKHKQHIFYENLIHSYRSFGGSNQNVYRIKENTDSRTKSKLHYIHRKIWKECWKQLI